MSEFLKLELPRRQVAIAGRVTDAQTEKAIARARVEITDGPPVFEERLALKARQHGNRWTVMAERPDRIHTAADGHFHFLDLPDGDYTLVASLPASGTRYGTAQTTVTLSSEMIDEQRDITMATADIALPPPSLKGKITEQGSDNPVVMAEVRVQGSGERTFTDGQGEYLLTGLEVGSAPSRSPPRAIRRRLTK